MSYRPHRRWIAAALVLATCVAAAASRWVPIAKDGVHDPDSPAVGVLQAPAEALALLPPDNAAIGHGLRAVSNALLCWRRGEGVPDTWATGLQATDTPVNNEGSADPRA